MNTSIAQSVSQSIRRRAAPLVVGFGLGLTAAWIFLLAYALMTIIERLI
jgi:hypothetical protein